MRYVSPGTTGLKVSRINPEVRTQPCKPQPVPGDLC
jgi:hypothetical protein